MTMNTNDCLLYTSTLNIALSIADLDGLIARKVSLDIVEGPILPMAASEIVRRKRRSGQRAGR